MRRWVSRRTAAVALATVVVLAVPGIVGAKPCGGSRRCECGDRVVADYVLPEDLGPCPADGLRLVERVRFDGGGHMVHGSSPRETAGIVVTAGASGSIVRSLEVRGFGRGIRLNGAERVEVVDVHAHHNGDTGARVGYGIDVAGGSSSNRFERLRVHDNADEGVHFGSHSRANHLVRSEIRDNSRENVYVLDSVENVVEDCVIEGGGNNSIYVKNSKGTVLARNRVADRPLTVRGSSSGTRIVDNQLSGAAVLLVPYDDAKLRYEARPSRTTIRGGRISGVPACVRAEGASETSIEEVALDCALAVVLGGGSTVTVLGPSPIVHCDGAGELRESSAAGNTGDGPQQWVVHAIRSCPDLRPRPPESADRTEVSGKGTSVRGPTRRKSGR